MALRGGSTERALVVLVHGLFGSRVQLLPIALSLSKKYDILNFGYKSRADNLKGHCQSLVDVVETRLMRETQRVHFVSHSYGGLIVHRAFSEGLRDILGENLGHGRCVLIGPPLRGASFARSFQKQNIRGIETVRSVIHGTARAVLGDHSGAELLMKDERWFKRQIGQIPQEIEVLVIAGSCGRMNPLIDGDSDGVVGVSESLLHRKHYRMELNLTHNLLLFSPTVLRSISQFLNGEHVGSLH